MRDESRKHDSTNPLPYATPRTGNTHEDWILSRDGMWPSKSVGLLCVWSSVSIGLSDFTILLLAGFKIPYDNLGVGLLFFLWLPTAMVGMLLVVIAIGRFAIELRQARRCRGTRLWAVLAVLSTGVLHLLFFWILSQGSHRGTPGGW